ncbi:tRNA dimethylallyltransferase [Aeromicrobium marinum DSM 15272]|uniref:tRNA dimethylallyltransferase n=1 Tax=Aeromicrobium marinum DSM 15272 TaxID=585531 RepID=E2S977_9ACTN|nr:tRNA (adenosine(37)-N6)-dimethylallyltransferase MiaA [Aeromicrobium marinum]EFQ83801.1 tRNA dimethylallyltransferase [Aeromicrobium marinum DSM 15272]
MPRPRVIVLVGPTGVGKSDLAIDLAERIDGEVVNADALQLYRGMDIGTAKVPPGDRRGVPHHLLDVLEVDESASVAEFQRWARDAVRDCLARGRSPVVVGGSSLYVRAVVDDLEFPGTDPVVRQRWAAELERVGPAALHAELGRRDPAAARQILPTNGRRIVRALEVIELTGAPFVATMPPHASVIGPVHLVGLRADRAVLDDRLERRVDAMWEAGLVAEVEQLRARGLERGRTAPLALGYVQALAQLRGECSEEEARADTLRGTRRFARRQEKLFGKDPRVRWSAFDDPHLLDGVLTAVDWNA